MKLLLFCGRVVGTEVGSVLGAIKPDHELDPGFLEYLRLSPRAFIGPGARLLEFLFTGPHADDATQEEEMELLHRRCCGLDVHKETVVACLRLYPTARSRPKFVPSNRPRRSFCACRSGWRQTNARMWPRRRA